MHRMYGGLLCFFGGENVEWSVREQGPRMTIEVTCNDPGDGLYKAWAVGQGRCLLGTMLPEGGNLCLRRTLSIDSLKRQGVWPIRTVECQLSHSFSGASPAIPWTDEVLRRSACRLPRHTVRRSGSGFVLSLPFDSRSPFPLVPLFCLSRVEDGRLIFTFREDGTPYIFWPDGKDRKETNSQRREIHGKSDHQGTGCTGRSAGF